MEPSFKKEIKSKLNTQRSNERSLPAFCPITGQVSLQGQRSPPPADGTPTPTFSSGGR